MSVAQIWKGEIAEVELIPARMVVAGMVEAVVKPFLEIAVRLVSLVVEALSTWQFTP